MSQAAGPLLEVRNLTHRFPDGSWGIRNINLTLFDNELLVLTGQNGSGKSVLMLHLNGLLKPTEGEVLYRGLPITKDLKKTRQKVGLVFQDSDNQIVGQTVEEDVAFGPENLGLPKAQVDQRVDTALGRMQISHLSEKSPHALSGGEKRRLAIAGLLALEPEILILDEPFSSLDWSGVQDVLNAILELHESGKSVIVITHDVEKVLAHGTRLVIMREGRVERDDEPGALLPELRDFGVRGASGGSMARLGELTWLK